MNNRGKLGIKVTKESLERVQKQLQEVSDQIDSRLKQAISETAMRIHGDAVRNAPVQTGSLKTSYQVDVEDISKDKASVYTENMYSIYVEYGTGIYAKDGGGRSTPWSYVNAEGQWFTTVGQRPQPHFHPAVDKHMERFYKAVDKLIEQSVK